MNYIDFHNKLADFFTETQIEELNNFSLISAIDAHQGTDLEHNKYLLADMGRYHFCEMLPEMTQEEIEDITSEKILPDAWYDLQKQFNTEW